MGRGNCLLPGCGCQQCAIRHYRSEGHTLEDSMDIVYGTKTPDDIYRASDIDAALQDVEELHRFF